MQKDTLAMGSISQPPPPPALWSLQSARCHMMTMLGALSAIIGIIHGSIGMVIVCMASTDPRHHLKSDSSRMYPGTHFSLNSSDLMKSSGVLWTIEQQAHVHMAFYVGSLIGIPSSYGLIRRFRAKRVLTSSLLLCGIGSFLTPLLAVSCSYLSVAVVRAVMGFGNGLVVPCSFMIVRKWFTQAEKPTVMLIFTLGHSIGILCSMLFTPILYQLEIFGQWPIALEAYGLLALLFVIIWELRAAYKPRHSSYVTASELDHIRGKRPKGNDDIRAVKHTPLKQILLSPCVIAICLSSYTQSFIVTGLLAFLPLFNYLALNMDLVQNTIWSTAIFLTGSLADLLFYVCGLLMAQQGISTTATVKIFASIATFGAGACILSLTLTETTAKISILLLLTVMLGCLKALSTGCSKATATVAPQFTQTVLTCSCAFSQLAGVMSPLMISAVTSKVVDRNVGICLLSALTTCTGVLFLIFAHGRREVYVEYSGCHELSERHDELMDECEHQRREVDIGLSSARQSMLAINPPQSRVESYSGGESAATIPLRFNEFHEQAVDEEFTSEEEY